MSIIFTPVCDLCGYTCASYTDLDKANADLEIAGWKYRNASNQHILKLICCECLEKEEARADDTGESTIDEHFKLALN